MLAATGIEALLVDQLEPAGETIAQHLDLPFSCISSGQAIHRRPDVPPFFTPWSYQNTWWPRLRNQTAGSPLVVEYAPQLKVLKRASLTITHGGINTVLDSLSYGVPLVAILITFEQPGTGARIRWTGFYPCGRTTNRSRDNLGEI